ncbi:MAG: FeoC-like transcriptional regulator [Oscillospiraceae bacterium]|nr:FeoC-like transcriptional regulator [Oscillospiraceae bacterium]
MIAKLLKLIENNQDALSFDDLAAELGTDTAMIGAALENLERQGIVKRICMQQGNCNKDCAGCIGCNPNSPKLFTWELI